MAVQDGIHLHSLMGLLQPMAFAHGLLVELQAVVT
jgi:hypothetical protein